jgi:hypothetical protein
MNFFGIGGGGARTGGIFGALAALNPAILLGTMVAAAASTAIQQGSGKLTDSAGGGFWGKMFGSVMNPLTSGLTGFLQRSLGGPDDSSKRA